MNNSFNNFAIICCTLGFYSVFEDIYAHSMGIYILFLYGVIWYPFSIHVGLLSGVEVPSRGHGTVQEIRVFLESID